MAYTPKSAINFGAAPNDDNGDGLRETMIKLFDNDEYLKGEQDSLKSDNTSNKSRLDTLEGYNADSRLTSLENENIGSRLESLESDNTSNKNRLTTLEGHNANNRLNALEGYGLDGRITVLEGHDANNRLSTLEGYDADNRLNSLEGDNTSNINRLDALEDVTQYQSIQGPNLTQFFGFVDVTNTLSAVTVTETSDKKYKKNIKKIDGAWALDIYKKLKFSMYNLTLNDGKPDAGLIAQEVRKIIPEAVYEAPTKDLSLNYRYINIICQAAIQHFITKSQI